VRTERQKCAARAGSIHMTFYILCICIERERGKRTDEEVSTEWAAKRVARAESIHHTLYDDDLLTVYMLYRYRERERKREAHRQRSQHRMRMDGLPKCGAREYIRLSIYV